MGFRFRKNAVSLQADQVISNRPFSPPRAVTGRVRLRTLVLTRWVAVFGQTFTIVFVYFVMGYDFPIVLTLMIWACRWRSTWT